MADTGLLWNRVHPDDVGRLKAADMHAYDEGKSFSFEVRILLPAGGTKWIQLTSRPGPIEVDGRRLWSGVIIDVTACKQLEAERDRVVAELQAALAEVKILGGFLPICSACKKIRDDRGYWNQLEAYISEHTAARFTHGICPDCAARQIAGLRRMSGTDALGPA